MSEAFTTVLVVDDSAFMRKLIAEMVESSGEYRVVGTAMDGVEALEQIRALAPDIVTLDIEMPVIDGIAALGYIMSEAPRAVVMLSGVESRGAVDLTLRALEIGAVDFVRKPAGAFEQVGQGRMTRHKGTLYDKHTIAVRVKAILLRNRVPVRLQSQFSAREGANQHQKTRLRQVEIG